MEQFEPTEAREKPTHFVVRSRDPQAANLTGLALANALDPGFLLLELRPADGVALPQAIDWGGLVPPDRHLVSVAPGEPFGPRRTTDAWAICRADAPDRPFSNLVQFLGAPEASEQLFRREVPIDRPLTILVANGHLAASQFPDDPRVTGRLLRVQKQFQISVIFTADETPREDYIVFDYLLDALPADGADPRVRILRAPPGIGHLAGDQYLLPHLPRFAPIARAA